MQWGIGIAYMESRSHVLRAGHTTLIKVTLSAIPIHISLIVELLPWASQSIDMLRKSFIWQGTPFGWSLQGTSSVSKLLLLLTF
jgi:hypothetical protein